MIEIFLWYFLFQIIHVITLPLCLSTFKNLPDRGYSINKSFSFLMISFFVYFFTRIIGINFNLFSVLISLFFLSIFSFINLKNIYKEFSLKNKEFIKYIIISEIIFLLIFSLALFFKSFRPDLDHGEGPMDFAYIQSTLRTEKLPPPYPWLAGTNLENVYYYFGHFSYAILIKLSGIETSKGYVLSLATTFALIGISSFSVGYNLTRSYKLGFLCLFLITFGSGLLSLFHLIFSFKPEIQFNITEYKMTSEGNFWTRFIHGGGLFWWSTRVIPWTITEFPWFSLLWGDLHAHFVSYSFIFVFVHLILDILFSSKNNFEIFGQNFIECFKKNLIFGISLGYMFPQFIWNYPIYVAFLGISLFFIFYDKKHNLKFLLYFSISFSLIVFLSILIYFEPIKNLLELNPKRSGLNLEDLKTSLFNFLVLYGLQIFCIYYYLLYKILHSQKSIKAKKIAIILIIIYFIIFFKVFFNYFENTKRFDNSIKVNWSNINSLFYDFQLIILIVPLSFLPIYFLIKRKYRDSTEMFLLISILFGTLVVCLFELFNIYCRYVFVFKLHQSVWIFWNISVVLILFYFKNNLKINSKNITFVFFIVIFAILLSSSIIYLIVTSISETDKFKPNYGRNYLTFDSMEFVKQNYPKEYEAIIWINKNINGNHIILEYPGNSYEFYPRPSTFTGLTSTLQWMGHAEQVTLEDVNSRLKDINEIYNTTNNKKALELLKKYNVEYIYVGFMEKNHYSHEGLNKFNIYNNYEIIYKNEDVNIYVFLE